MSERVLYPDEEQRRRIMDFIMAAGQTLLENGAEVFRVEQTMEIMARSFHLREFHVYILTNGIFASAGTAEISEVRNVPVRTTHLGRVAAVNELSRQIAAGGLTLDEAEAQLARAQRIPFPNDWVQLVAGLSGAFCFAMIFGGTLRAGLAAAVAGLAASFPHHAGLPAALSSAGHRGQPCHHRHFDDPDARYRLYHGHPGFCAGRLPLRHHPDDRRPAGGRLHRHRHRFCAVVLFSADGGEHCMSLLTNAVIGTLVAQFFLAAAGTLSFAILFACPRRLLPYCALVGGAGWLVYELAVLLGADSTTASLLAVIPLTLLTRVLAILLKAPVTVFLLTGIFPLVPGAGIYYTAYYFIQNNNALALSNGISTFKIAVVLATGIALVLGIPLPHRRR